MQKRGVLNRVRQVCLMPHKRKLDTFALFYVVNLIHNWVKVVT